MIAVRSLRSLRGGRQSWALGLLAPRDPT